MILAALQTFRTRVSTSPLRRPLAVAALITLAVSAPAFAVGLASGKHQGSAARLTALFAPRDAITQTARSLVWEGRDIDGDGESDVINPTGQAPRGVDAYGSGRFGASRDGGVREHMGVDYVAAPGQAVAAPISGFVSKIGYAYAGDEHLRFVEIDNPALKISARVFYVEPDVEIGQPVRLGAAIGAAQTLQAKYPDGITDHVHLEIADNAGRKLDAATLIVAHLR